MSDINHSLRKEVEQFWPQAKKTLTQLNKDAAKLFKNTEKNLVNAYAKTKKTTEEIVLKAQREKLYYDLGKIVAPLLTSDQLKNKTILQLSTEIHKLTKKIRRHR